MKVSQIGMNDICNHIREIRENLSDDDLIMLETMKKAAISYCCGQTGLEKEQLDEHEDIAIAVLSLIADMWDNRSATTEKTSNVNRTVDTILSMHCINLLPRR